MLKKILTSVALLMALVCALASCGGGNGDPSTNPQHIHAFEEWETVKDATCTEEGTKERYCTCGEKQTATIAMKAHTFGEWTVTKEATKEEVGEEVRTCVCGEEEKREIEKLPVVTTITEQQWKNDPFRMKNYNSLTVYGTVKGKEDHVNYDCNVSIKLYGECLQATYTGICKHGETSIIMYEQDDDKFYDLTGFPLDDVGENLENLLDDLEFYTSSDSDWGYSRLVYSETDKSYTIYDDGDKFVFWFEDGRLVKFSFDDAKAGKLSATFVLSDFNGVERFELPHDEMLDEFVEIISSVDSSTVFCYYDDNFNKQYIDADDVIDHFGNLEEAEFEEYEKSIYEDTFDYEVKINYDSSYYYSARISFEDGMIEEIRLYTENGTVEIFVD